MPQPSIFIFSSKQKYFGIDIDAHNIDAYCIKKVMMKKNTELEVNVRPSILILSLEQEYLGQKMSF